MGASASRGWDNQSLIDKLLESGPPLPPDIERAMRLVDRGDYFEEKSSRAYLDLAWRSGSLHLSAPSIYVSALNHLDLAPGQHFLNVGSGSGYLSTIIGLILGHNGINHGIEVNESNVCFSKQRLGVFLSSSDAPLERDFCIPQFLHGNIFDLVIPSFLRNTTTRRRTTGPRENDDESDSDAHEEEEFPIDVDLNPSDDNQPTTEEADAEPVQPGETDEGSGRSARQPRFMTLPIDPPPIIQINETSDGSSVGARSWPMYDRIYVGGGVRSRVQLQGLLRLLKIGGIMIAPVQDELMKITRLSENRISRVDLLSVSFASLVVPSANEELQSVEPPFPEETPSLLLLCARYIRRLLRTRIELLHNGRPVLGRLVKVDSHETSKKKRKKKEDHSNGSGAQAEQSSTPSNSSESGEDSDSEHSELLEESHETNGGSVPGNAVEHSAGTNDHPTRPESPDPQQDSGSMVRFLHHLLLRSRMPRNRAPTPPRENPTQEPEDNTDSSTTDDNDRSRIILLDLSHGSDQPRTRNQTDSSTNSRMRFHLRVAERFMAVLDSATDEDGDNNTNEEQASDVEEIGGESSNNQPDADTQSNPKQRQEKRRRGLKYQPPSYTYRDEMRRIMSEELHLPEYFVRHVFLM